MEKCGSEDFVIPMNPHNFPAYLKKQDKLIYLIQVSVHAFNRGVQKQVKLFV